MLLLLDFFLLSQPQHLKETRNHLVSLKWVLPLVWEERQQDLWEAQMQEGVKTMMWKKKRTSHRLGVVGMRMTGAIWMWVFLVSLLITVLSSQIILKNMNQHFIKNKLALLVSVREVKVLYVNRSFSMTENKMRLAGLSFFRLSKKMVQIFCENLVKFWDFEIEIFIVYVWPQCSLVAEEYVKKPKQTIKKACICNTKEFKYYINIERGTSVRLPHCMHYLIFFLWIFRLFIYILRFSFLWKVWLCFNHLKEKKTTTFDK